jgi:hypothetical protein
VSQTLNSKPETPDPELCRASRALIASQVADSGGRAYVRHVQNIAADLGLSSPPSASVSSSSSSSTPGVGAGQKADESLRSSMAALMADRLMADSHTDKAKTAPPPTTTSKAGGQKKDPFDGLFQ